MQKWFYIFVFILFTPIISSAKRDSIIHIDYFKAKKRASAYDTNAIYYNKGKINLRLAIGSAFDNDYVASYQNTPGVFGILNPQYSISYSPTYNLFADYGITPKSQLGIGFSYQQDQLNPNSGYQYLSRGNVFWLTTGIRYSHCIRSWKFFYYGAQFGAIFLKPSLSVDTYLDKPSTPPASLQAFYGYFGGVHFPVAKNLWLHFEGGGIMPIVGKVNSLIVNETLGLNYCINTRNNSHKHSNIDFDSQLKEYHLYRIKPLFKRKTPDSTEFPHTTQIANPDSAKIRGEAYRDSAKARRKRESSIWDSASIQYMPHARDTSKRKHIRSVYDTASPYYNKGKINISIESGNTDMDVVAFTIFGNVTSGYNQSLLPLFSVCADYGIGRKSDVGIDCSFQQVDYTPKALGVGFTPGNLSLWSLNVRYLHCFWSWKYFYYGVKCGVDLWYPSFNSNTFYEQPDDQYMQQVNICLLMGVRITLMNSLFIHGELLAGNFAGADYGLTYRIDTRKKKTIKN